MRVLSFGKVNTYNSELFIIDHFFPLVLVAEDDVPKNAND